MYNFRKTGNIKLGTMPVTRSPQANCPDTCSLKGSGCYAENFRLGIAWKKDLTNGISFSDLIENVKKLPKNTLWRHNEAGDLSHNNGNIIKEDLDLLVRANTRKQGFTYTHHIPNEHNSKLIKTANDNGFTINLSAETIDQADEYFSLNIAPVVSLLPIDAEKVTYTKKGVRIVKCPASYQDTDCQTCKLCYTAKRNYIIGFPAHGNKSKKVEKIFLQNI